ncbi:hypothetical protein VFPBJ_11267 [Purpureocillium lilacinum]|uniref:Uncharacterized protein n=1 Tax=Purpureocillium lilacinum TaxID=33203 RepID=A0A179FEH0_PURLI|nr:hypothetical protein VFPBJ_11267 [Purpureocillium lilacinum]
MSCRPTPGIFIFDQLRLSSVTLITHQPITAPYSSTTCRTIYKCLAISIAKQSILPIVSTMRASILLMALPGPAAAGLTALTKRLDPPYGCIHPQEWERCWLNNQAACRQRYEHDNEARTQCLNMYEYSCKYRFCLH